MVCKHPRDNRVSLVMGSSIVYCINSSVYHQQQMLQQKHEIVLRELQIFLYVLMNLPRVIVKNDMYISRPVLTIVVKSQDYMKVLFHSGDILGVSRLDFIYSGCLHTTGRHLCTDILYIVFCVQSITGT